MYTKFPVSSFKHSGDMNWVHNLQNISQLLLLFSASGSGPESYTMFRRPTRVFIPNRILIRSAILHSEAELSRVTDRHTDRQTPRSSVTTVCNIMHLMQRKKCDVLFDVILYFWCFQQKWWNINVSEDKNATLNCFYDEKGKMQW